MFVPDASPALTHPIGEWPCTAFDRRNAATLALMHRTTWAHHPRPPTRLDLAHQYEYEARLSRLARCHTTTGGAWSVLLDPAPPIQWSLHHLGADGREVGLDSSSEAVFLEQGEEGSVDSDHAGPMTFFDFDDDGEPEVAFTYERRREHGESEALLVFRYRAGRIERFPTVPGAQHLEDVDHDGRPDVVITHSRYSRTTTEPEDNSCGDMVEAPSMAARSVPGGRFSVSDPAVREYNRRECSVQPAAIVARDPDGLVDEEATTRNVVCAGVWGVRRATIVAALRACGERVTTPDCETVVRRPDGCRHIRLLSQWATEFP